MTHRKQINKKLPRGNKYCRKVQPYERYWARRHGDARNWGRPMPLLTKSQHLRARKRARAARMWYIQYTIDQIPHILRVHSNREYVDAIEEAELLQHGPIVAGFLARWWRGSYYCGARDAKFRQLGGDENNEKGWAEWKKGFKYRKMGQGAGEGEEEDLDRGPNMGSGSFNVRVFDQNLMFGASDAMSQTSSCSAMSAQPSTCKESHGLSEDEREVEEHT